MRDFLYNVRTGMTSIVAAIIVGVFSIFFIADFLVEHYPKAGTGTLIGLFAVFVCWGIGKSVRL